MFDLERAIHDWKQRGQRAESVTRADIDELEEHLRESIAGLVNKDLTEEEAFLVASIRLDEHAALGEEFGKVNSVTVWSRRVLWMVFGYVGGIALASAISGFCMCLGTLSAYLGYAGTPAGLAGVIAGLASWATVVALLYLRTQRNDATPRSEFVSAGWLVAVVVLMVTGTGAGLVASNVHAQIVPMDQYGASVWWTSMGGLAIQCSIMLVGTGLILTTRARLSHQSKLSAE